MNKSYKKLLLTLALAFVVNLRAMDDNKSPERGRSLALSDNHQSRSRSSSGSPRDFLRGARRNVAKHRDRAVARVRVAKDGGGGAGGSGAVAGAPAGTNDAQAASLMESIGGAIVQHGPTVGAVLLKNIPAALRQVADVRRNGLEATVTQVVGSEMTNDINAIIGRKQSRSVADKLAEQAGLDPKVVVFNLPGGVDATNSDAACTAAALAAFIAAAAAHEVTGGCGLL